MTDTDGSSGVSRRAFVASVMGAIGVAGVAASVPTAALAAPGVAPAALLPRMPIGKFFLRATGVTGDALDRGYVGWIPVVSWSWGTIATTPDSLTFRTRQGRHSAALFGKAFSQDTVDKIELNGGGQAGELLRLTLSKAIIAQGSDSGASNNENEVWGVPSFGVIKLEVRSVNARGALTPWESMTWNISTGVVS